MQVISAFETIAKQQGWQKLPRFALGGSSGGAFALHLALRLQLSGMCIQIMGTIPEHLQSPPHAPHAPEQRWQYPPTAFVHMARDMRTAGAVRANMGVLQKQVSSTYEQHPCHVCGPLTRLNAPIFNSCSCGSFAILCAQDVPYELVSVNS